MIFHFLIFYFSVVFLIQKYNNILTSRQGMSDAHIQAKIREYLSRHTLDSHLGRLSSSSEYLHLINDQLPHLTPNQIRSICKAQEQNIIQKVLPIRSYDLYSQITEICPSERDLKYISSEQVTSRLNLYNSKLILTERPTCQSQSQQSWEQSKSQTFFGQVHFDMCIMQQDNQQGTEQQHTMRNIFQQCDHQHAWNTNEYFGLT